MAKYLRRKKRSLKPVLVLVSVTILVLGATFGTLAYLSAQTNQIVNEFTPSRVTSYVVENDSRGTTKKDVKIQNTGDTEAFIRASIVITWQRYNETTQMYEVCYDSPTSDDYVIDLNSSDWFLGSDGYYYYKNSVKPGLTTSNLINSITPVNTNTPEGYGLCVEILSSAIQYVPASAVESAWPAVQVENGVLTAKSVG